MDLKRPSALVLAATRCDLESFVRLFFVSGITIVLRVATLASFYNLAHRLCWAVAIRARASSDRARTAFVTSIEAAFFLAGRPRFTGGAF